MSEKNKYLRMIKEMLDEFVKGYKALDKDKETKSSLVFTWYILGILFLELTPYPIAWALSYVLGGVLLATLAIVIGYNAFALLHSKKQDESEMHHIFPQTNIVFGLFSLLVLTVSSLILPVRLGTILIFITLTAYEHSMLDNYIFMLQNSNVRALGETVGGYADAIKECYQLNRVNSELKGMKASVYSAILLKKHNPVDVLEEDLVKPARAFYSEASARISAGA